MIGRSFRWASLAALPLIAACGGESPQAEGTDDAITSNAGAVLEFRFSAETVADKETPARQAIIAQLQYLQGVLTTDVQGNAQVGFVELTGIEEGAPKGDVRTIKYSASLPVIWPKAVAAPKSYEVVVPRDISAAAEFNRTYDGTCGKAEYGAEYFWHDFNPKAAQCHLKAEDVVRASASVAPHPKATSEKYPEYTKILEDDAIDVVGIFGIITNNAPFDEGVRERETFLKSAAEMLKNAKREDLKPPQSAIADSTVTGTVDVGGRARRVTVTAFLVQELASVGRDFDDRYSPLSEKADFVVYSGHAGLGSNVAALAEKTRPTKGKYQLVFINGCQTFAYLGRTMHDARIALNGANDDPNGTKYLDVVANALPSYSDNAVPTLALMKAMIDSSTKPRSYNDLLTQFSQRHLTAVFGEEDNAFQP